jgi:hypothetical protein
MALENYRGFATKLLILNGGQRRDRTADAGLFRAGVIGNQGVPCLTRQSVVNRSVTHRGTVSTDMSASVYRFHIASESAVFQRPWK